VYETGRKNEVSGGCTEVNDLAVIVLATVGSSYRFAVRRNKLKY
jgi:hypothetical protein